MAGEITVEEAFPLFDSPKTHKLRFDHRDTKQQHKTTKMERNKECGTHPIPPASVQRLTKKNLRRTRQPKSCQPSQILFRMPSAGPMQSREIVSAAQTSTTKRKTSHHNHSNRTASDATDPPKRTTKPAHQHHACRLLETKKKQRFVTHAPSSSPDPARALPQSPRRRPLARSLRRRPRPAPPPDLR